jgi:type I restriction enzyme M protein
LFFTKGERVDDGSEHFHTETIWYYAHPYPPGYKSYSKTKPIRFEEFAPEQSWWGSEDNDFADRVENEHAWKVDFKAKREQAVAAAQPFWGRAEQLSNEASALDRRIRDLRESIKGISVAKKRQPVESEIETLRAKAESLRLQARDAQAAGDRLYWPIYNLDEGNPRAPKDLPDDPDELLKAYKQLLSEIEETESRLKSELAAALAHHFVDEGP